MPSDKSSVIDRILNGLQAAAVAPWLVLWAASGWLKVASFVYECWQDVRRPSASTNQADGSEGLYVDRTPDQGVDVGGGEPSSAPAAETSSGRRRGWRR